MPIVRLSAIEQQGVTLPSKEYTTAANLGQLVRLMLDNNSKLTQCGPGMAEDITPWYFTRSRYTYRLTTPQDNPPETATIHLLPKDQTRAALILDMRAGGKLHDEVKQIVIPTDSIIFPLCSPSREAPHPLILHELLVHTGAAALRGLNLHDTE